MSIRVFLIHSSYDLIWFLYLLVHIMIDQRFDRLGRL